MRRRRGPARRSATEWGVRGLLALVIAALSYVSLAWSLGNLIRNRDPARAYSLASYDGRLAALLAQRLSSPEANKVDRARAERLARAALSREPLSVVAASTLGVNAQIRGDITGARRLFAYAERLSRRDLQTQLWAVEDAVGRGDIQEALQHYDIALRTSRRAPDLLFPVLGSALAEPAVRAALAKTLSAQPSWAEAFVRYAAANSPAPDATAKLFLSLGRSGSVVPDDARATLLSTLVSRGLEEQAWSYYAARSPEADRRRSRDPQFSAAPENPSPFDWASVNDAGIATSIQRTGRAGLVDFQAPASVGGTMLQQVQVLPPGAYELVGRSLGIDQPEGTGPYWTLICRNGRELGRIDVPNSAHAGGRFGGRFTVPVGCPVQTLALIARPTDGVRGLSGQIDQVLLVPAR